MTTKHATDPYDVAIIGGGPAGSTAAIALARAGLNTLVIERRTNVTFKLGESLPPHAVNLVCQFLGLLDADRMAALGMTKITGNLSCWESSLPSSCDFFCSPPGYGLRLERPLFDQVLRDTAQSAGAVLCTGEKVLRLQRRRGGWDIVLRAAYEEVPREVRARFVLDCSGRHGLVAHLQGITRQQCDRLFAFCMHYSDVKNADNDTLTRVEAGPHGWWYSARLGGAKRLVVFHTDQDLATDHNVTNPRGFDNALREYSQHIGPLLDACHYVPEQQVRGAPASGGRLQRFGGHDWLAAGDAAQSFDPLSSQGIYTAMRSGWSAGQTAHALLDGHSEALDDYSVAQTKVWDDYCEQHNYFYSCQRRWADEPFWRRRQPAHPKAHTQLETVTL